MRLIDKCIARCNRAIEAITYHTRIIPHEVYQELYRDAIKHGLSKWDAEIFQSQEVFDGLFLQIGGTIHRLKAYGGKLELYEA